MTEQWQELKETIIEMRDNDGTGTQQEVCNFLANYMDILEKQMQEPKTGYWITEDMFDGDVAYRCSECNELFWLECGTPKDNDYNFCPKCGMRLVEPQEGSEADEDCD